jgi:NADPH:quinone reductase-like Zn-dependent oxidoreductase
MTAYSAGFQRTRHDCSHAARIISEIRSQLREDYPSGLLRDGGAFTTVRGFEGTPQRDIRFTTTFVRTYAQEFERLDRLRQLVEAGKITLRVAQVYPPERAADAHRRLEAGGTRGRLVIRF